MTKRTDSLAEILGLDSVIHIVDIGANPIDGEPPYMPLLVGGRARLVGFEPNPQALAELNRRKGPHETYFPHAVADGRRHTLHVCHAPGMTSLLEPNAALLAYFHGFPEWGEVTRTEAIETVRLDDVAEIVDLDYLKIDIQGGELMAMQHATGKLATCTIIQTEVEFLPMYRNQPLFSEIELFLRGLGFVFHKFEQLTTRAVKPLLAGDSIYAGLGQVFWADAVFVRDFTRLALLSDEKLRRAALVLHDVYKSYDPVARFLWEHDQRASTAFEPAYVDALSR